MCGIAGYIGPTAVSGERVDRCLDLMARRGPDGRGVHRAVTPSGANLLLLHTRLSIIDLDPRSDQPMERDGSVLVLNGEIYNYLEVRRGLETRGEVLRTEGDTETLLVALSLDGEAALDGLEGMWAFALYHGASGLLTLCRDRFGEKPLYLFHDGLGGTYFASEIPFLVALSGRVPAMDREQMERFLVYGYRVLHQHGGVFFTDVEQLGAGRLLVLDGHGGREKRSYWSWDPAEDPDMSFDQAVSGVRRRLLRSMELRLRSDVPLAFCMSGGVDSNALICTARREFGYDVHGFTVVNTDSRYAESDLVDLVVRRLGLRHTKVPVSPDGFLDNMRGVVAARHAPVLTISYYVHWLLMREVARSGYKVAMSGTGADELFTGYYDHHNHYLAAMRDDPGYGRALENWREGPGRTVRNPVLRDPEVFVRNPGERGNLFLDVDAFAAYLFRAVDFELVERAYSPVTLRNRMLNELFVEVVPVILHEDDHNAMHFSVENRSPFLDRDLFEFSLRIPTRHLVREGRAKAVLREAMRGIVPDEVLDNPRKVGFNAPVRQVMPLDDPAFRAWLGAGDDLGGLVRPGVASRFLDGGELSNSRSKFLFSYLGVKMFHELCGCRA